MGAGGGGGGGGAVVVVCEGNQWGRKGTQSVHVV